MLTKTEALKLVSGKLKDMGESADPFVVIDESTIEKPFGWVFFYNSKKFLETGMSRYRLAGNGPVIVNKFTGAAECYGSGKSLEQVIRDYEANLTGSDEMK